MSQDSTFKILRNKFPASEYVIIREVSNASGFSRSRSLDYMLINLWVSRGLAIHGIEKKSNRSDWTKELKNPAKQEDHFKYCDYFWLLTDKEGVAKIEEIPPTWGWYHITKNGTVRTMKAAPKLNPIPITRSFMCAMFRRAADLTNFVHRTEIEEQIEARAEEKKVQRNFELEEKLRELDKLKEVVNKFEKAAGVQLQGDWWRKENDPEKIGTAVRLIIKYGMPSHIKHLEEFSERIKKIAGELDTDLEKLKSLENGVFVKEETVETFCLRNNICPQCGTHPYECGSDHK
jgi:hypothetical protein